MDQYKEQLQQYIRQQTQAGYPVDQIRNTLIASGWDIGMVDQALTSLGLMPYQPAITTPPAEQQSPSLQPLRHIDAQKKYKVFRAIQDTITALKHNVVAYVLSAVAAFISASLVLVLVANFGAESLSRQFRPPVHFGASTIVTITIFLLITYAVTSAMVTVLQIVTTLALSDGADGHTSDLKNLLTTGIRLLPRVIGTNIIVGLLAAGPLFVAVIFGIIATLISLGGGNAPTFLPILSILLSICGSGWLLIAMLRYTLASMVAIMEPELPLRKIPGRSSYLLHGGGQWFILKGALITGGIIILIAMATGKNLKEIQNSHSLAINIGSLLLVILANGVLLMLYRNRRIVSG